ncbi:activating transcription factor 7-interacting protein 1 isoform X2 [Anabas testudineus]|uniref:activating transcription factor 7-interacting protein 1 isoform X2 n=1 Tax=Anabas testudineus TaxID=64144 RepID=UPI000E4607C1|nr:activating transcription factor 7-interacting protein 1 isoform X2 [Anabas testudineus]
MEVVVTEEKKKIFRAKKTMKISDRQQLESLHSTLLTAAPASSQSPKAKEETPTSPTSPFHSLNYELKKMEEEEEKKDSSSSSSNESVPSATVVAEDNQEKGSVVIPETETKEEGQAATDDQAVDSAKDSVKGLVPCSPVLPTVTDCTEPMDTDSDTTKAKTTEASTAKTKDEKPSSPKTVKSDSCPSSSYSASSSCADLTQEKEIKDEDIKEEKVDKDVKKGLISEEKMEVDSVKVETKKDKTDVKPTTKLPRPSSTPPSNTVQEEKGSTSGLKRTLSEGFEKDAQTLKKEGKRPKMEREELEAQLELKITAKAGSHHKLGKIVQQLVDERLRILELTIFDKHFQELKERVDKIDCATKHQTAISTLQAKIARLSKKFGEANQLSENKRKQEALAAAAAAKTATAANNPQAQRPLRTSMEVKQTPVTVSSSSTAANPNPPAPQAPVSAPAPAPATTSTSMVPQAPILQLITSTSNAASTLATGITTQSPTGTLLLKTAPGSSMVATGQPLLIQLPISMTNGQAGTLVNIPVSSLSAATSLNKAKTTASTATFILKPASTTTTAPASAPAAATVPALQASTGQTSPAQISLARAVYPGGAGAITTPNAGVSVTTARTPAQSVSVAGAMSSATSPTTSGPAATGSAAPGPPQGTSLTSKTESNMAKRTSHYNRTEAMVLADVDPVASEAEDVEDIELHLSSESEQSSDDEDSPPPRKRAAQGTALTETARDGTAWREEQLGVRLHFSPIAAYAADGEPTPTARSRITSRLQSFLCLVNLAMLQSIREATVAHGKAANADWFVALPELMAFIAIVILRGLIKLPALPDYWSATLGHQRIKDIMPRERFQAIMRHLRFDDKSTRVERVKKDKFAAISELWGSFARNCIASYTPGRHITVDEQLLPTKTRCSFLQYVATKPDKFGIKFWVASDLQSKYVCNVIPYLGKDPSPPTEERQTDNVVMMLMEPFLDKGRNVTTDSFFTSLKLAQRLHSRNTTIRGTAKCGVDQMVHDYSVRKGTQRWPVSVFYNLIDMAALNAHVLYQACTGEKERRADFLDHLATELAHSYVTGKKAMKEQELQNQPTTPSPGKRALCQVKHCCTANRTTKRCAGCYRYTCGQCIKQKPWMCHFCG